MGEYEHARRGSSLKGPRRTYFRPYIVVEDDDERVGSQQGTQSRLSHVEGAYTMGNFGHNGGCGSRCASLRLSGIVHHQSRDAVNLPMRGIINDALAKTTYVLFPFLLLHTLALLGSWKLLSWTIARKFQGTLFNMFLNGNYSNVEGFCSFLIGALDSSPRYFWNSH